MFAYCNNNPCSTTDSKGCAPFASFMLTDSGENEWPPKPTPEPKDGTVMLTGEVSYHGYRYSYTAAAVTTKPKDAIVFHGGNPFAIEDNIRPKGTYDIKLFDVIIRSDRRDRAEAYGYLGGVFCRVEIITLDRPRDTSKHNTSYKTKSRAFIDYLASSGDQGIWADPGGFGCIGGGGLGILHPVMY